jgi:glycosyltransferase involved in cell wall biosynthesis
MKILQISTYDIRGGAARATYRLHCGLRNRGLDCRMLVRYKDTDDTSVSAIANDQGFKGDERFLMEIPVQEHYINAHRTDISNTMFSLPYPGYDISQSDMARNADIINLHWVSQYQSTVTLLHLFALGKPMVWTLHDQWAFTGGCHYSAGCEEYCRNCKNCPQLTDDPYSLPEAVLRDKEKLFKNADLTIVTPSRWMGNCAIKSRLFKTFPVEVIANSLETDLYSPLGKDQAKRHLGISADTITLLFGAIDGAEKRKGFSELVNAMEFCRKSTLFQELLQKDRIRLLCFGSPNHQLDRTGIPFISLGRLETDEEIRDAYSAAEIFLLPSLEDNLPNTVLEAMSCGTPVIAFQVGGVPDMVTDGVTGRLVRAFDVEQMSEAIVSLALNPDQRSSMGKACREKAINDYPLPVQAENYLNLYEELLRKNGHSNSNEKNFSEPADRINGQSETPPKIIPAMPNTDLGAYFGAIYDKVLFQALKSFAPIAHNLWQNSEVDRAKRLGQVERMTRLLESCEADREARLHQINELTDLLETCETDRSARLENINRLNEDIDMLNARLAARNSKSLLRKHNEEISQYQNEVERRLSELQALEADLRMRNSEILRLQQKIHDITERAHAAEKALHALENTQVVRNARKVGLIKLKVSEILSNPENEKHFRVDEK